MSRERNGLLSRLTMLLLSWLGFRRPARKAGFNAKPSMSHVEAERFAAHLAEVVIVKVRPSATKGRGLAARIACVATLNVPAHRALPRPSSSAPAGKAIPKAAIKSKRESEPMPRHAKLATKPMKNACRVYRPARASAEIVPIATARKCPAADLMLAA